MQAVPAHPVPAGPLAVRWLGYELEPPQAGALGRARVALENAGAVAWSGLLASYHWLDDLGNALVWDGLRTPAPVLAPAERGEIGLPVRAPIPPGRYRLAFDLVVEHRYWLAEIGNTTLDIEVDVLARDASAAVAHLPEEVEPAPDWQERVRAAHEEGYAAVGGSLDAGRRRALRPWAPGSGRNPAFAHPLVCPSLLPTLAPNCKLAGLPAWRPEGDEPWIYDGRITARLRSGRRRG